MNVFRLEHRQCGEPRCGDGGSNSLGSLSAWILVAALAVFTVYALNFLYFFVDDEGIPFVYAQNLLRRRGLIYTQLEGPVEGYTDFLHVMFDAVVVGIVRLLDLPKVSVFFIGKTTSFLAGAGTVAIAFLTMRRSRNVASAGAVAGMAVLCLAGPFAVWSCSSLETVPFTFFVAVLVFALSVETKSPAGVCNDRLAVAAAACCVLERLDGPVFVGAILLCFTLYSAPHRRKDILQRIVIPTVVLAAVYHAWRIWYFGDILNMPFYAKVLYKVRPHLQLVIKAPARPYWRRFVEIYGWVPVALSAALVMYAAWHERSARRLAFVLAALLVYVSVISDWMFGFRFFVPLFPLIAILIAESVTIAFRRRRAASWLATCAVVVGCVISARAFERDYEAVEQNPSWLRQPTSDAHYYFGSYYGTLEMARELIRTGSRVADNQSGFLPFMLDLENIDDLGICSRFYAKLPSDDKFYTEVGRFAPLTEKRLISAEEAYLLYRDVPFIIQRTDLLRNANNGHVPVQLLGGYYAIVAGSGATSDAIYRRTERDASEFKRNPALFFENLAHVAYIRQASINDVAIAPADIGRRFAFLREATTGIDTSGTYTFDVQFSKSDTPVSAIELSEVSSTGAATIDIHLMSVAGIPLRTTTLILNGDSSREYGDRFAVPVRASRLRIRIASTTGHLTSVAISDVRVQGQTAALARYIRKNLQFPPQ